MHRFSSSHAIFLSGVFVLWFALASCQGGGPAAPDDSRLDLTTTGDQQINVSPTSLDFGETSTQLVLRIANTGEQGLAWSAQAPSAWLTLPTPSGRIAAGASQDIPVTVSRSRLTTGSYTTAIQITSNGGEQSVAATLRVSTQPSPGSSQLIVSPTSLDFGDTTTQLILRIGNSGGSTLSWSVQAPSAWLSLTTASGQVAPGASQDVPVAVSRSGFTAGTYTTSIRIASNGGNRIVTASMRVPSQPDPTSPEIAVSPSSLNFGDATTQLVLHIGNTGGSTLTWSAAALDSWLALSTTSGQVAPGAVKDVMVHASRSGLSAAGTYLSSIRVASNGGTDTVPVSLEAALPPPSPGGSVNVRHYGALGNGVHDDAPAFRAALLALGSAGGSIYVPAGTYNLKPSAGIPNRAIDLTEQSNITIYGDGQNSTSLRLPSATYQGDTHIIYMLESSNITIRDLALDGNRMNASFTDEQNHCAEVWRGSTDILFERVLFHNCRGDGIRLLGPTAGTGPWTERVTIRHSRFQDNGRSGVAVQRGVRFLKVLDNTFDRINDQSIDMEPTGDVGGLAPTDILIEDNVIRHTTPQWAVTVGGISSDDLSERVTFRNNQVLNGAVALGKITGMIIEGNTISGDSWHGALRIARNVNDVDIVNNVISGLGGGGQGVVQIVSYNGSYPSHVTVSGNRITATAGQTGLYIRDALGHIAVTDNVVTGMGKGNGIEMVSIATLGLVRTEFSVVANTVRNFAKGVKLGTSGDRFADVSVQANSLDHNQSPSTPTIGILFDKTQPYETFASVSANTFGTGIINTVVERD